MRFHSGHAAFLFLLLSLTLAIVVVASVETQSSTSSLAEFQDPTTNLTDSDLKSVVIQFERTLCYGNCPGYKLTIRGNGQIEYEGGKNVKQVGHQQGRISVDDLKRLVADFSKAKFFTIDQFSQSHCPNCTFCTDMPTAITEIKVKESSHRVEHYYGCRCAPKALWELEGTIDKIARTEQWTGDVSQAGPFGTTCVNR
jgi:hypothetical protein